MSDADRPTGSPGRTAATAERASRSRINRSEEGVDEGASGLGLASAPALAPTRRAMLAAADGADQILQFIPAPRATPPSAPSVSTCRAAATLHAPRGSSSRRRQRPAEHTRRSAKIKVEPSLAIGIDRYRCGTHLCLENPEFGNARNRVTDRARHAHRHTHVARPAVTDRPCQVQLWKK